MIGWSKIIESFYHPFKYIFSFGGAHAYADQLSTINHQPSSVNRQPPTVIRHPSSVIRHPSSVIPGW
jgi:hypothetical protein